MALKREIEVIASDVQLCEDMKILPSNYSFEIPKTIWKIRSTQATRVALQFPEGLLIYSCIIADLLHKYTKCSALIMADVTYGACCVDDLTAKALGCQLLVHYGHSCLVPIQNTDDAIQMLYVFVSIEIGLGHLIDTIKSNFSSTIDHIALISTIQFVSSLKSVQTALMQDGYTIMIPQCKPLSPGEILGCTSPRMPESTTALVYVGDGRFHLESAMIQNPKLRAFQYDPYARKFTSEKYDFEQMHSNRHRAICAARKATSFGLILGTLGRQGNVKIFENVERQLRDAGKNYIRVLMSEVFPDKLKLFVDVECWIQIACPRLSIDWGESFATPLLTPYELAVALNHATFATDAYPMDYYAYDSLGEWTNNHVSNRSVAKKRNHIAIGNR